MHSGFGRKPNAFGPAPNAFGVVPNAFGAPECIWGPNTAKPECIWRPNAFGSSPNAFGVEPKCIPTKIIDTVPTYATYQLLLVSTNQPEIKCIGNNGIISSTPPL